MSRLNIAVIGGGSVGWMSHLMRDLYLIDEIDGGAIGLVDPNVELVQAVAAMLQTFNRQRGKSFEISVCEDRRDAMKGCDFVICTFSPGSLEAFEVDLEIPLRYGIRQPVSMTVGPSGISASLRTVPVACEIVQDMEAVCPGAWLLNVTNPMSAVTRAMNLAARTVQVVGMCHEFHAFPRIVGPLIGLPKPPEMLDIDYLYRWLPEQGVQFAVAGLNHFIFLTKLTRDGKDLLPVIRQAAQDHQDLRAFEAPAEDPFRNHHAAKLALCRTFGYLPIVGDRHLVEFWPHLCNARNGYATGYRVSKTTIAERRLWRARHLDQIRRLAAGAESDAWHRSGEELVGILHAIHSRSSTTGIVNLPNRGQISNLPNDVIVETLADVADAGVRPWPSGDLPGPIGSLARLHAEIHELTVEAALSGSRSLLVQALSLDPSSAAADFREIDAMAEDLLQANRRWLPRFFG